jgi:asparagine synthase (glutamine-hydrolysing)
VCGIAGIAQVEHDAALLDLLGQRLHHRGPDGGGVFRDGEARVGLVARRLAILDLALGEQPMASADGRHVIVFNGEVYNAPALRSRLEREGYRFASDHSDTEVVLALYALEGSALLGELNGMFAFAIYDRERRTIFAARDRFGIKPLYYARPQGGLVFASELRTMLDLPGIEREVDRAALYHYLSLRFVPGSHSIVRGVERLPPGHWLEFDVGTGALRVERWWRLRFDEERGVSRDEWVARLRAALGEAVVRWSLSDVPIGCSLSGGLDSGAIAGLLAAGGAHDVRTYSLGFAAPEDERHSELALARALAERWGTEHHEVVVDANELLDDLPAMVWALDEPYGGGLPSWYVFRFMAGDVKVGLTGTGGDELFGNYRRFAPFETGRLARLRRRPVRRYHHDASYYLSDAVKRRLVTDAGGAEDTADLLQHVYDDSGSDNSRDSVLYLDTATQLPDEFLHMTDRFSMAHSLEARTPFLDHELVELVASMPASVRTSREDPKGLLREAVADLLTPAHLAAPKHGFVFPLARWLRNELRPLAERVLSERRLREQGLFDPGLGDRYLRPHLDGRSDESERLWPLLMFQLWHLLYVEERVSEASAAGWRDLEGIV